MKRGAAGEHRCGDRGLCLGSGLHWCLIIHRQRSTFSPASVHAVSYPCCCFPASSYWFLFHPYFCGQVVFNRKRNGRRGLQVRPLLRSALLLFSVLLRRGRQMLGALILSLQKLLDLHASDLRSWSTWEWDQFVRLQLHSSPPPP